MSSNPLPANSRRDPASVSLRERDVPWRALEQLSHLDPAGRGLASYRRAGAMLDEGQLRSAAIDLATRAQTVAVLTGFCVVTPDGVTAETDGPPGAFFLARALSAAGADVILISDALGMPLLAAGQGLWKLSHVRLVEFPHDARTNAAVDAWLAKEHGEAWSHLVAIERPGPSHTLNSLERQPRDSQGPSEKFLTSVPKSSRDRCHNMRGEPIELHTAPTHRIFERVTARKLSIATIGIGDGGNEIGMGRFAWETLADAIASPAATRIISRVATDYTLIGGTSDWAAYALALTFATLCGVADRDGPWNARAQSDLIECLVRAGAVDGISRRAEPTVDGLPLETYLEPLTEMRRLLGLPGK